MPLEDKISQDYIQAMKDKNSLKSSTLSFLRAQIKYVKIEKRVEKVEDVDVVAVIKKQIKQRQDSIAQFEQGARQDLADKEKAELVILKEYLPQEMSADSLRPVVDEVIKQTGAASVKDMGRVMKEVMVKVAGQADNKTVSDVVKEQLSKL